MEKIWWIAQKGKRLGPYSLDEISAKIKDTSFDTHIWREGYDDWRSPGEVPQLVEVFDRIAKQTPPAPPPDLRLKGVGGWLIVVGIGQFASIITLLGTLAVLSSADNLANKTGQNIFLLMVGFFLLVMICTYLFVQQSRYFPKAFIFQYVVVVFLAIAFEAMGRGNVDGVISAIVMAAFWISYCKWSKRVALTFVN